jgi:hypothetical protein
VHCASWIDAVWDRKHQTVEGSGRRSLLRQLARWSRDLTWVHQQKEDDHDLTWVHQQKKKDGRFC